MTIAGRERMGPTDAPGAGRSKSRLTHGRIWVQCPHWAPRRSHRTIGLCCFLRGFSRSSAVRQLTNQGTCAHANVSGLPQRQKTQCVRARKPSAMTRSASSTSITPAAKEDIAMAITLIVNGGRRTVPAEPDTPLLYVLRNDCGLNGAKFGCGLAQCGACTVFRCRGRLRDHHHRRPRNR